MDILSGSYSRIGGKTMAGLFQVLWGQEGGGFAKARVLDGTDERPLIIPVVEGVDKITQAICTRPTAVDWDHDGDLDLVVGNFEGSFYYFEGKGQGKFAPEPKRMKCGVEDLRISGAHSDPFAVDWDGDGDLDLLSGTSRGGVEWSENVAGKGKVPELRPFKKLTTASGDGVPSGEGPSDSTRVWVDDVNGDGKLDLLLGDHAIINNPVNGLTKGEMMRKKDTWQKKLSTVMVEMSEARAAKDGRPDSETMKKYQALLAEKKEFMDEERTGFVWLLLQK